MWHKTAAVLALCQIFSPMGAQAAATWPSSYDEIEDLMMLQTGYRAKEFASIVTPCSNAAVPGFKIAAGFVRTAFHDVAAADKAAGINGLDASIGYELSGDFAVHNTGPSFNATMTYLSKFYNSKASMADLLALGLYSSVRSCGGPIIPIRTGRVDASQAGEVGLPDVQDSQQVLIGRFAKMGFSPQEMIELVACGHTLGGVHPPQNPPVAAGNAPPGGVLSFDTTNSAFDNKVCTEYIDGTTRNPLVVGPPQFASDARVFSLDGNITISAMTNPTTYNALCQNVLQRMIDIVPSGVQLSDAIDAYDCKPGQLDLNAVDNGASIAFSGEVRIRTTIVPKSHIAKVQLVYKDRMGGSSCGDCTIDTTEAGDASGFDNSFTFYGFSTKFSSWSSISSFDVVVTTTDGQKQTFNNNGAGFAVQDSVFVQSSSSSISDSGALNVVAAVRNDAKVAPQMSLSLVPGSAYNTLPKVSVVPVGMNKVCSDDTYTYYSGSSQVSADQVGSGKVDVKLAGGQADTFRSLNFQASAVSVHCAGDSTSSTTISSNGTASTSSTRTGTASGGSGTYTPPVWTVWNPPADGKPEATKASAGASALSSIYVDQAEVTAVSDGTDGGNKNIGGLDLSIVVTTTSITIPTSTPSAGGAGPGGWTLTGSATVAPAESGVWSSWSAPEGSSATAAASTTKSASSSKFTGAASNVAANTVFTGFFAALAGLLLSLF